MMTELPKQDSWVFRLGEIVCYIEDATTELRQARVKIDSEFWQINPKTREIILEPTEQEYILLQLQTNCYICLCIRDL